MARSRQRTFAERLDHLFATIRPNGLQREYTNVEVAHAVGVSDMYVGLLRRGQRSNPSAELVRKLERFFGLTEPYLCNDDPDTLGRIDKQLELFRAMRDSGVLPIALRAAEIHTQQGRDALAAAIEEVIARERARDQLEP